MSDLKVGDTVRLKSGGPLMTVTTVGRDEGTPYVWTSWFDDRKESQGHFPAAAVEKDDDKLTFAVA